MTRVKVKTLIPHQKGAECEHTKVTIKTIKYITRDQAIS